MTAPAEVPGPVVGAGLWRQVTDRAGGRCECDGQCGRRHKDGEGRCTRENSVWAPLHAVPRDAAPFHAAVTLPASALDALCDACHAAVASAHAKARQAAHGALSAVETLF